MESKRKRKISVESDDGDEVTTKLPKTTSKKIDEKLGKFMWFGLILSATYQLTKQIQS